MFSYTAHSWHQRTKELAGKLCVLGILLALILLFASPLKTAFALSHTDDRYVQVLVGPLICAYLLYWDRQNIFSQAEYSPRIGILVLTVALVCLGAGSRLQISEPILSTVPVVFGLVLFLLGAFVFCFGTRSMRAARYALCCLWLAVPIPPAVIDGLTAAYQQGSAAISLIILELAGVSVLRDGTSFSIPGLDFRIAPECSGIRSGLAFLMVSILASRLYLKSSWTRSILILSTIPIAMFKNAIRIVVTTSLGAYVDRSFIDGPFHHKYGGLIFSPLDFLLFVPLLLGLQKLENLSLTDRRRPVAGVAATAGD